MSEDFTIGKRKKKPRIDVFDNMGSDNTTTTTEPIPDTKQTVQDPLNTEQEEVLKSINFEDKAGQQFNPFAGNVDPRGEHANIKTDQTIKDDLKGWTPPPINFNEPQQQQPINPVNPTVNTLAPEEQELAAERMVDFTYNVYEILLEGGKKLSKTKREKVIKLHTEGKIDMNYPFPVDSQGTTVPFIQYLDNFNEQVDTDFVLEESFKKDLKQIMTRIYMKRGIGLSDEQAAIVKWLIRLGTDISKVIRYRQTMNKVIEQLMLIHGELLKKNNVSTPNMHTHAQPQQSPNYSEPEEANVISEDEL